MQEKIYILINALALFWWVHYTWRLDMIFKPTNLIRRATECDFCTMFWSVFLASAVSYFLPELSQHLTWATLPFAAAYFLILNKKNDGI
jgi:uncharacterized membrane protein YwzB